MKLLHILAAVLVGALLLACDREGKKDQAKNQTTQASTPSSTDSSGGARAKYKIPQVGVPHTPREQYKPVVGKYGGQLVRDTLGEPKSFNPITSGETSTSDYTERIFE